MLQRSIEQHIVCVCVTVATSGNYKTCENVKMSVGSVPLTNSFHADAERLYYLYDSQPHTQPYICLRDCYISTVLHVEI
jgi:hypothetical protein